MNNTFYHESGKGSHARKRDVSEEQFRSNWEKIFGKKPTDSSVEKVEDKEE